MYFIPYFDAIAGSSSNPQMVAIVINNTKLNMCEFMLPKTHIKGTVSSNFCDKVYFTIYS